MVATRVSFGSWPTQFDKFNTMLSRLNAKKLMNKWWFHVVHLNGHLNGLARENNVKRQQGFI